MSWKTVRKTHFQMSGNRASGAVSFGDFSESFRGYLVSLSEARPELFGEDFFFQSRSGFESAHIGDPDKFVELAIKHVMEVKSSGRDKPGYTDAEGKEYDHLKPEFFVWGGLNNLRINVSDYNGAPDITFGHRVAVPEKQEQWTLIFNRFSEDMPVAQIDELIEHGFSWWPDVRRVRASRAASNFSGAVRKAAPSDAKSDVVYWKNWQWNQPLSTDPLPELISQHEAHGGVWTVVEGADEAPADPNHPLVALCAEATRISLPR